MDVNNEKSSDNSVRYRKPSNDRSSLREKDPNIENRKSTTSEHGGLKRHSSMSPAPKIKTQKSVSSEDENAATGLRSSPKESKLLVRPSTGYFQSSPKPDRSSMIERISTSAKKQESHSGKHSFMVKSIATERVNKFKLNRSMSDSGDDISNKIVISHKRSNSDRRIKDEEEKIILEASTFLKDQTDGKTSKLSKILKKKSASLTHNKRRSIDDGTPGKVWHFFYILNIKNLNIYHT